VSLPAAEGAVSERDSIAEQRRDEAGRSVLLYVAGTTPACFDVIVGSRLPELRTPVGTYWDPGLEGTGYEQDAQWTLRFAFAPPNGKPITRVAGVAIAVFSLSRTRLKLKLECLIPELAPSFDLLIEIIQANLYTADTLAALGPAQAQTAPSKVAHPDAGIQGHQDDGSQLKPQDLAPVVRSRALRSAPVPSARAGHGRPGRRSSLADDYPREKFLAKYRELIAEQGTLSQEEFARILGVGYTTLKRYRRDRLKLPWPPDLPA
jgi:hypothetical protein